MIITQKSSSGDDLSRGCVVELHVVDSAQHNIETPFRVVVHQLNTKKHCSPTDYVTHAYMKTAHKALDTYSALCRRFTMPPYGYERCMTPSPPMLLKNVASNKLQMVGTTSASLQSLLQRRKSIFIWLISVSAPLAGSFNCIGISQL